MGESLKQFIGRLNYNIQEQILKDVTYKMNYNKVIAFINKFDVVLRKAPHDEGLVLIRKEEDFHCSLFHQTILHTTALRTKDNKKKSRVELNLKIYKFLRKCKREPRIY